jgi:hypothetical protein
MSAPGSRRQGDEPTAALLMVAPGQSESIHDHAGL